MYGHFDFVKKLLVAVFINIAEAKNHCFGGSLKGSESKKIS